MSQQQPPPKTRKSKFIEDDLWCHCCVPPIQFKSSIQKSAHTRKYNLTGSQAKKRKTNDDDDITEAINLTIEMIDQDVMMKTCTRDNIKSKLK
jgi:hypothetical protein